MAASPLPAAQPDTAMHRDEHAGRVPFRLWIGVTGHRELPPDPLVQERVREVLERICRALPASDATPLRLGVVSSLAEGADRLVAREVLAEEGALLEVPLPLTREQTYAEAGHLTVDRCDRNKPLYWTRTGGEGGYEVVEERSHRLPQATFRGINRYNRAPLAGTALAAKVEAEPGRLRAEAERAGLAADLVEPAGR